MTTRPFLVPALFAATLVLSGLPARPETPAPDPVHSRAAFERLKKLAGEWTGTAGAADGEPIAVNFRVTGGGSALVETQFPGTDHEMVSIYYTEGEDLVLVHYCAAGNQPRLRLDRAASRPDDLRFVYAGGSNHDPAKDVHIHNAAVRLLGDDRLESDWSSWVGGKDGYTAKFLLNRKK